ncbi:MAG: hypothetical protein ACP5IO_00220 [Elusimicrobiales bacterium]
MLFKKVVSGAIISAVIIMLNHPLFADNLALESAKSAATNPDTFDGKGAAHKLILPQASLQSKPDEPKQEPSFAQKLVQDIKDNKTGYATVLGAAGFLGFILGGPVGMLIGIGAMFAFTLTQRADYIDAYVKPR